MKAIIAKQIIEMTKAEVKAVGIYGTVEHEELMKLRQAFPNFRIQTKVSKSRDNMKGLNVAYMEKYIKAHNNSEEILKEFYTLRGLDEDGKKKIEFAPVTPYGQLKQWFLTYYPEVSQINNTVNDILKKAAKKRMEAQKAV